MLKRLFTGLVLGAIVGALVAAAAMNVLGASVMPLGAVLAFALAAATGMITGLVAGKPIWASGGQIEAGLKAFFGALLAAGGMYAIRTWLQLDVDLTMAHAGHDLIGNLPGASLPLIGAVLGGFYELDNTPEGKGDAEKGGGARKANVRVANKIRISENGEGGADADDEAAPPVAAKKRSR